MCLYILGQNCLHHTFSPYLSSETYSRKYEKLPNIVIYACENITKKWICWKCVARKFGFVYLRFDPMPRNIKKTLSTIVTFSWLGGTEVTHLLWVRDVPCSISGSGKSFYVWFSVLLLLCFYFFVQKHIICHKNLQYLLQC